MHFISHSSKDKAAALDLRDRLLALGYDAQQIFLDSDEDSGIAAGWKWEQTLYERLKDCRALVVLCSPHWQQSKWCFAELVYAKMAGKEVFPVVLADCDLSIASEHQAVFVNREGETAYERLFHTLEARQLGPKDHLLWPHPDLRDIHGQPDDCPFPGLPAFDERYAGVYFGRERETQVVLEELRQMRSQGEPRLLMIVGGSGSGKSSLLMAGVLPRLNVAFRSAKGRSFVERKTTNWLVLPTLRFGRRNYPDALFVSLAEEIVSLYPPDAAAKRVNVPDRKTLRDQFASADAAQAAKAFLDAARDLTFACGCKDATVLLPVDQFDELLPPSGGDNGAKFLKFLKQVCQYHDNRLLIIGTMRSDYLDVYERHPHVLKAPTFHSWRLEPFPREQIANVIVKPAARAHVEVTPELLEQLKQETPTTDALPLLAFTLEKLYRAHAADKQLDLSKYKSLGGMEGSIRHTAEQIMPVTCTGNTLGLSPTTVPIDSEAEAALRRCFVNHLVQLNERGGFVRRPARWTELPAAALPALERFIEKRLLVSRGEGRERVVEVSHEAIFRVWDKLAGWLNDSRDELRLRSRLAQAAHEWFETGSDAPSRRDTSYLWSGGRLDDAEQFDRDHLGVLNELEREFLDGSIAKREFEKAEEERHQETELRLARERETEAQARAEDARAAELEQTELRRLAQQQAAVSESQRLAFAARLADANEPSTALLLACEAVEWDRNSLSEQALRDALDNVPWTITAFTGHSAAVNSAAFSRDGELILTASSDQTVRLWNRSGFHLLTLKGHCDRVTNAVFSPDERSILTVSTDGTARLWSADGKAVRELMYGEKNVGLWPNGEFSSNAKHVLVCDGNNAWLWDSDGARVTNWDPKPGLEDFKRSGRVGHIGRVFSATFSPDGKRIITASEDRTAQIWDVSGQQLAILSGHKGMVVRTVFHPMDGQIVLTGATDRTARLWNADGVLIKVLEGHSADVGHLVFSGDGQLMLTAADGGGRCDSAVRIWDCDGNLVATLDGHTDWITDVAFSPDSQHILTASVDGTARMWDRTGKALAVLKGHRDRVVNVAFSPDGKHFLTASDDGTARIWERAESILPTVRSHVSPVTSVCYNSDGTSIFTSSHETTCLWDAKARKIAEFSGKADLLNSRAISPDGKLILTVDSHGVHLSQVPPRRAEDQASGHDTVEPSVTMVLQKGPTSSSVQIRQAEFSPDGKFILTVTEEFAQLWNQSGKHVATLNGPNLPRTYEAQKTPKADFAMFNPAGREVLTASENGMVWLWSLHGELRASFLTENYTSDNMFSVTYSPDGQHILTTVRRRADLWDRMGCHVVALTCGEYKVKRGLFSPDGERMVTLSESVAIPDVRLWDIDGGFVASLAVTGCAHDAPVFFDIASTRLCIVSGNIAQLWDRDGNPLQTLACARTAWIKAATFSPKGDLLLTAMSDGTAQLWCTKKGIVLATLRGHSAEINKAVFDPDMRRVLTASSDGTARQFLISVDALLSVASRRVGHGLTDDEICRFNVQTPLRFDPLTLRSD